MAKFQKSYKYSNDTVHTNAQCKVVIFPWKEDALLNKTPDSRLAAASRLDISSKVISCKVSKTMGTAAGSFSFTLANSPGIGSQDWKDIIKRGYWCIIYMTQDGDLELNPEVGPNLSSKKIQEAKKIRCIGYIERVAVAASTQENRGLDITFEVSGRDFGIIYEETNIWHNLFVFDKIILDSIAQTKLNITGNVRIHTAIELIHDLFYYPLNLPGAKVNSNKSMLSIGLQWLLPKEMLVDIGFKLSSLTKGTFWGALKKQTLKLSPTGAGLAVDQPGDFLTGNAWEELKKLSIPQFHELFCETTDDGKPNLVFRPIPWGIDNSKYKHNRKFITLYKDLKPVVNVPASNLYDFNIGEDDHARYNSFLATVSTTFFNTEDNTSLILGQGFPLNNYASIKRHGFRPMHVTVDSIVKNGELANGSSDLIQLVEFNHIIHDYWNNAVFAETGSAIKLGTNDVKIGKVLKFNDDVPYLSTKRYYIEGYTDTFNVEDDRKVSWVQEVNLTRGFEEDDLQKKSGFLFRGSEFIGAGEYTKGNTNK